MSDKRLITIREYCDRYGTGRTATYELLNSGRLRSSRMGTRRLIWVDSAEALMPDTEVKLG